MKTDHPKPYQFYLLFLLAGVLLIFCINSCRKENIQSNKSVVIKALNGHGIDITRLQQAYQQGTSSPLKVNDISSQTIANIVGTLNVDWSSYTLQEFPDSSKIIEFPMPDDTTLIASRDSLQNGHNKYTSKTCAVFVLHKDTIVLNFFMKTVESLNAPGYQSVINQLHYQSIPGGFNGEVMYFTLGRQFINGYVWQNGSIKQSMTIGSAPASPPSPASQNYKGKLKVDVAQVSNCVEDDYELVWINSNGTEDPTGISWTVITCDVTNTDGSVLGSTGTTPAPPPCTTGSGAITSSVKNGHLVIDIASSGSSTGSSTPTPTPQPCPTNNPTPIPKQTIVQSSVKKITDSVTKPCLKSLIDRLTNDQTIQTDVTNMFRNTFGTSDAINITFNQGILTGVKSQDAASTDGNQANNFTVTFNNPVITNSSQEYLLETTLHEIFHAYLDENPSIKGRLSQHMYMIQNYITIEIATLQKVFPGLTTHDALCLALSGYGTIDSTVYNNIIASYGLTANEVFLTNSTYKSGVAGTNCN